jgi:peptide chain release factor 2
MAGGKGGQSVNTTYSAVRVTHLPTGITVVCQNERSQVQNRQIAIKYLKNKLAVVEAKKQENLRIELRGELQSAEWGSQIRSYVLHPYKLIKDNRSNFEINNVENILEYGNLLEIIWSVKRAKQ